jgi:ankyrin repeat protein
MATKKRATKAAKPAAPRSGARGTELVDAVIASVLAGNERIDVPVPADVLAKLRFPDASSLPPSLVRWLAFDGGWLARTFHWFDDPADPELVPRTVEELVRDDLESAEIWAPFYRELPGPLPRGLALPLDWGTESLRFLFLSEPDADGEYAVLWLDNGEAPTVGLHSPGIVAVGDYGQGGEGYGAASRAARLRLLGRKGTLECRPPTDDSVAPPPRAPRPQKPAVSAAAPFVLPKGLKGARLFKALEQAIEKGDARKVLGYFAAAKAEAPKAQTWKNSALSAAVTASPVNEATLRALLEVGANPNARVEFFGRILCQAVSHAHRIRALEIMLEAGGDPNAHGNRETAPIQQAAAQGNIAGVKALLAHGADPNGVNEYDQTGLHGVAAASHISQEEGAAIAEVLLAAGTNADHLDKNGDTALLASIERRRSGVARVLLAHGADPNLTPKKGAAPLVDAWFLGDRALFELLKQHGARLDAATGGPFSILDVTREDGFTPARLDVRVELDGKPQTVNLRVRSARTTGSGTVGDNVRFLATTAAAGMAGSDVFPPSAGHGRVLPPGDAREAPKDRTPREEKPFYEFETPLVLGGVAPEALAAFVASLTRDLGPIAELSLVGERALSVPASACTVDTARVTRWLRGELEGSPRPFPTPAIPFEVHDRGKSGRVLAVSFAQMPEAKALETFDTALTLCHTRFRVGQVHLLGATVLGNVVVWKRDVLPGQPHDVDAAPIRAAALNGLSKLGGVERVEWALGVDGDDGTPFAGKGVMLKAWLLGKR